MLRESEAYGPSSFQSTLSMRRATSRRGHGVASRIFQSTLSMRRATKRSATFSANSARFQSTLSMRRATHVGVAQLDIMLISIHALHEESDKLWGSGVSDGIISIHALHEESDQG